MKGGSDIFFGGGVKIYLVGIFGVKRSTGHIFLYILKKKYAYFLVYASQSEIFVAISGWFQTFFQQFVSSGKTVLLIKKY